VAGRRRSGRLRRQPLRLQTVAQIARALNANGAFYLVLYGTRWPTRHSYVEGSDGTRRLYTAADAHRLFADGFKKVRVRGFSRWVDLVRNGPLPIARAVLAAEVASVLRFWPDQAYFLIVEGRRA
jgi:hypothetical protein